MLNLFDVLLLRKFGGSINPVKKTWSIVPTHVQAFLDWAAEHPYDPSDYSVSYFDSHEAVHDDDPVGIAISLPAGNLVVVDEYNSFAYEQSVSAGSKTIYNLIPGEAVYAVENNTGVTAVGYLLPTGARRFIRGGGRIDSQGFALDQNIRDLGGIPCNGGSIRFGKIIRGGAVYPGDSETVRILHDEVGIRAELDLLNGHLGYTSSPIGDDVDFCCPVADSWDWAYYYLTYTDQMREAFQFIFDSVKRGRMMYIHCQQGADRTGTISVLIEALLGVSQSNVDVDYELTSFSADANAVRKRSNSAYQSLISNIVAMSGDTFQLKVANYIMSLGFSATEINEFIASMVDGTPSVIPEPTYHNLADPSSADWKDGYRITSSGIAAQSGKTVSNPVPVVVGDVIRVKGVSFATGVDRYQLSGKNSGGTDVTQRDYISNLPNSVLGYSSDNGVHTFTVLYTNLASDGQLCFAFDTPADPSVVIITKNEVIT